MRGFGCELMERLLEFANGESGGACAGDEFGDELGELAVALGGGVLDLVVGDEGSGALLGVENAAELHFAVGTGYGVGIYGEIDGDAADGGELVTCTQGGGGDSGLDLIDQLAVDGYAGVGVETEGELGGDGLGRLFHFANVLVY